MTLPSRIPLFLLMVVACTLLGLPLSDAAAEKEAPASTSLFDLEARSIDGELIPLRRYHGKVLLIVNTASGCGFTRQYADLEALYKKYAARGFEVLAFPSNDFMNQEPGTDAEIRKFCSLKYNVSFPIFSRAPVTGADKQPVYAYLTQHGPREYRGEVGWNFVKFVLDRTGNIQGRFSSRTNPRSAEITGLIERLLAAES